MNRPVTEMGRVDRAVRDGVGTITFSHPKSNALPGQLLRELASAINALGDDDAVLAIVLQSAGERAFCAGASFDELLAIEDFATGKAFFMGFAHVINALRQCPKFVIGRIQGKAVGGGVGLAAAVDHALATDAADIKLSELAIGIGPFVVGPAVERKIGRSGLAALAIDATAWKSAAWAEARGLYTKTYPDIDALDAAVSTLAHQLAHSSPAAMRAIKRMLWADTEHWDTLFDQRAAVSGRLVLSEFTVNAIREFKARGNSTSHR
ncbi:MAG: enoyl-CoA hydratase/isomerase family protein [Gammaproteobacteria bacterium]|nr:enoyl-CoA hydratase/isomerase family protein [Gammaproteobacteria bacterium]